MRLFAVLVLLLGALWLAPPADAFEFFTGATCTEVASGTADAQAVAASSDLRLLGFSCRENAAGTAEFIIRNGTNASAPAVAFVRLSANESVREFFGEQGLQCPDGIFIDRVSGTTHISVFSKQ